MANSENFYGGAEYSFDSESISPVYGIKTSELAFPSDPLTANQLQAVSKKISTGAKTIEVSGLGLAARSAMSHLASIPKQHWKEIDRLRKLTGVDLTFHGPLIEATGYSQRENWTEDKRQEVERQALEAVKLAQQMNPDGNVVVTFHSSNGLPEVEQKIKIGTNPDGSPEEKTVSLGVYNERTGQVGNIPSIQKDYFEKGGKEITMTDWLKEHNEKAWKQELQGLQIESHRARQHIDEIIPYQEEFDKKAKKALGKGAFEVYNESITDPKKYEADIQVLKKIDSDYVKSQEIFNNNVSYAKAVSENNYVNFKEAFNKAFVVVSGEDKNKLEEFKKKSLPVFKAYTEGKSNVKDFNVELSKGVNILTSLKNPPEAFQPLAKFAYEKAGQTFGNVAWNSYKKFKDHTPIISIENPPVGMTGLTRAEEIAKLVKESQRVFVKNATLAGMSEKEAQEKAKKIIGATWDVGHINSMRKWGYDEADVIREARIISPHVKHMHIADNLGFEDAELPLGMGNVPINPILKMFPKGIKKTFETGDWFSKQGGLGMAHTPVREAFEGASSNVYTMGESPTPPYWSQISQAYGAYFGGIGTINPDVHHSIYGAGFSGLPVELGGEIPGQRSRFSGAPME